MSDQPTDDPRPATVYVVDDDPELCESVAWLLDSIGITPRIFHSADEFLAAYNGDHAACIVLDVRMPQISGTRLQEKLTAFAPHVAIIFVSAHGDIRMSVSTLQAGALDFLEKPYEPQRLLDAVQAGGLAAIDAGALSRAHELEALGFLQLTLAASEKIGWTGGFTLAK